MEAKAKVPEVKKLRVKVVAFGEYLIPAKEMIESGYVGMDQRSLALALLYHENGWPNKKIESATIKGESKFVVEV